MLIGMVWLHISNNGCGIPQNDNVTNASMKNENNRLYKTRASDKLFEQEKFVAKYALD